MENNSAIIDYLRGDHSIYSREEFEDMLNNDPTLNREFQEQKEVYDMVLAGNMRQKLSRLYNRDAKPSIFRLDRKFLAIAASLLVLIATIFILRHFSQKNSVLYEEYYKPANGLPTLMSENSATSFDDAMVEYKMGNYKKAQTGFEKAYEENVSDTTAFYIAQSAMAQGKLATAESYFALFSPNSAYFEDVLWYRTLIKIEEKKNREALKILDNTEWVKYKESSKSLKDNLGSK